MKTSNRNSDRHLIVGAGEVGKALYEVLRKKYDVTIRDKDNNTEGQFDVLHIAFPPVQDFVRIAKEYIKEYRPKLVIVHSTVPVGTTRRVSPYAVHSPIRGMHMKGHHPGKTKDGKPLGVVTQKAVANHFAMSMKIFPKYFGGKNAKKAAAIFTKLGIKTEAFQKSETTELLKILDTTYFGWNIVFVKEVKRICDELGLDFDEVYTLPNMSYNQGYTKLGMGHVVRPVLRHIPGKIGGHCVVENCDLLDHWLTKVINEKNKEY